MSIDARSKADIIGALRIEQARNALLENALRQARSAARHALQFLEDPQHKGDGHLDECIAALRVTLATEPRHPAAGKEGE